jgi:hypothetical protein
MIAQILEHFACIRHLMARIVSKGFVSVQSGFYWSLLINRFRHLHPKGRSLRVHIGVNGGIGGGRSLMTTL